MCGRYYRRSDKQKIAEAFHVAQVDDFALPPWDYNVAPTTQQPIIRNSRDTGERERAHISQLEDEIAGFDNLTKRT
jgi:putative SOS response-associated peptidase YedK